MANRCLPFYKMWVMNWFVDTGVLTPEQRGALAHLMAYAWQGDPPCTLPDDEGALAKLSGLGLRRWRRVGAGVLEKFERLQDGRWCHRRLLEDYEEAKKIHDRQSAAGKVGAAKANGRTSISGQDDQSSSSNRRSEPVIESADKEDEIRGCAAPNDANGCMSNATASAPTRQVEVDGDIDEDLEKSKTPSAGFDANIEGWTAAVSRTWVNEYGGTAPSNRELQALASLIRKHGTDEVCRRLTIYCHAVEARFVNLRKFAQTFGKYDHEPDSMLNLLPGGPTKVEVF